eukprot:gnl/Spiro4/69_TR40_c0_g1_i1.p1 gnl/Spiro4/69_TR40_c0_g1~~gnl/Spiro4/69_TR40_c0_g1_i1.p1  ORF type:complete len:176 (+),score=23.21 gnl/Spiro4/69_TR40_c0_g1_i1:48-575(+)
MWRDGRPRPNILITGTPGTGKTVTAGLVAERLGMQVLNVGALVVERSLYESYDEEFQSYIPDEERLLDEMEEMLRPGGFVVEHVACELFPERWFDLVVVLTANIGLLAQRLVQRGYAENKVEENLECERFQVLYFEAKESYAPEIVMSLCSDTADQLEDNIAAISQFIESRSLPT